MIRDFLKILYEKLFLPDYHIFLNITFRCNYQCSYCCFREDKFHEIYPEEAEFNWQDWSKVLNRFPPSILDISGGEPFLYCGLLSLLKNLDEKHEVAITTNLSFPEKIIKAKKIRDDITVTVSFHPEMTNLASFKSKICKLIESGIEPTVNVVGAPDILSELSRYETFFNGIGLDFHANTLIDPRYENEIIRMFHQYKEENIKKLRKYLKSHEKLKEQKCDYEERKCIGGSKYFVIAPNGDIYRCFSGLYVDRSPRTEDYEESGKFLLGNIFENFESLTGPESCSFPCCVGGDLHARERSKGFVERFLS